MIDIEKTLSQELHQVVDGLDVPALPVLPHEPPQSHRHWQPLLAAAAVVLVVLGVVAVVAGTRGGQDPEPAPSTPTPTPTATVTKSTAPPVETPRGAPRIPYTVDDELYVDGEQVPGTWWYLQTGGPSWLAMRADDSTWWWGRGPEPHLIEGATIDSGPVLSPDGMYVALLSPDNGGIVTGFDTTFGGEGLGSVPVDLGDPSDGSAVSVRAVTNDGKVIVQGTETALLWLPFEDNSTVDLTETAPRQEIIANTPAGLDVTGEPTGVQYLSEVTDGGQLPGTINLPAHDSLVVSPGAEWMAWTPPGTFGGEVTSVDSLEISTVDGGTREVFEAPDGWAFKAQQWAWETDDYLVSPVLPDRGEGAERMVRCSILDFGCVLIK